MSKKLSLYILFATIALIGVLFFQVIQPFIFSLLFAAVLAVLFRPAYTAIKKICFGRRRVAAAVTTVLILLVIMLPLAGAMTMAGIQLYKLSQLVVEFVETPEESKLADELEKFKESRVATMLRDTYEDLSAEQQQQVKDAASKAGQSVIEPLYNKTVDLVGDAVTFVIGCVIMVMALYYFLADGESILQEVQRFSPLEASEETALFEQFEKVCRGVVMGSVVAGLVQAILAGIGFAVAGVPNVWLLMAITMFFSFIPFLGAGSVCIAVTIGLVIEQRYVAAGSLFVYSMAVVATSDNLIKAHVIGGESKLNPLVVLITVIGALQLIGLWGIFVGPMVAAFFYALLKIIRERMVQADVESHFAAPQNDSDDAYDDVASAKNDGPHEDD